MAPSWGRGRGPRGRAAAGSLLALLCGLLGAAVATDTSTGQGWLKAYGYLLPPDSRLPALQLGKAMQSAVAAMQQFYGIPVTGVLDPTTIESLMNTLNKTGPRTDPWGTPLATGLQLDSAPLSTSL
ncbi:matrix metalloproteinase-24-like isoform X2 [Struthio camelus]|uniref:matrix metalloproteinase-24-like isoform X2 n=1 Tax=Struthio camelus TaxID=8801 RepID=UPI003603B1CE